MLRKLLLVALGQIVSLQLISGQVEPLRTAPAQITTDSNLLEQLRWHDDSSREQYLRARDNATNQVFGRLDGFVSQSLKPNATTAGRVKLSVDAQLGRREGDLGENIAFTPTLASGKFLIVGVDVPRGGPAIAEDAISIRAYRNDKNQFGLLAETGSDLDGHFLNAKAFPTAPVAGEFWLIAWGDQPPRTPYTVALRIYAFDGSSFRTVWSPDDIVTRNVSSAVRLTPTGFSLDRIDQDRYFSGLSPYNLREEYTLTVNGPQLTSSYYLSE